MKQDGGAPAPKHPGSAGGQLEFRGHPGMGLDTRSRGDETGSAPRVPAPASKANFHFPVAQKCPALVRDLLSLLEHQRDDPSSPPSTREMTPPPLVMAGMYESNQFHLKLVLCQGQTGLDFQARSSHLAARTKAAFHSLLVHRPPSWAPAGLGRALRRQVPAQGLLFSEKKQRTNTCRESQRRHHS